MGEPERDGLRDMVTDTLYDTEGVVDRVAILTVGAAVEVLQCVGERVDEEQGVEVGDREEDLVPLTDTEVLRVTDTERDGERDAEELFEEVTVTMLVRVPDGHLEEKVVAEFDGVPDGHVEEEVVAE